MASIPKSKLDQVVKKIARKLSSKQYAIRGTASVFLQGFDMGVDDIDVIGNKETVLFCNQAFRNSLIDKVSYKKSEKFKSYFGKFEIGGVPVEVYGDWQIKDAKGKWSEIFDASIDEVNTVSVVGLEVKVTKIETELKMFSLMSRWSAYWKLKRQADNRQTRLM